MEQKEERSFWRRGKEPVIFLVLFLGFFSLFAGPMGLINMLNTMMNTAHDLLMNTVFYLMAICVMAGALSALLTEFGVVAAVNRLLSPLLGPVYDLPGAASLGIVTTFLSDNPAILTLAHDRGFRKYFRRYQLPALTNLGTSFGMGLIVCTYMLSLQAVTGESYGKAVLGGLAVSRLTRLNLDGWLGLAVAAFILRAGWSAAKDTIDPLLGAQPDPAMVADIESLILSHPPVLGIHDLIIHDYGPGRRMMSVHAEVPAASGLVEVHHVIDHIERELGERFGLEAVIHLDPVEPEDPLTRRLLALAAQAARELDPAATIHDLRRTAEGAVSFDVVVPYDVALTDGEVRAALSKRLEELEPGAGLVIGVDRSHVL